MSKDQYKCIARVPQNLADGRMVAPGEVFDLDQKQAEEPHNQKLLESGAIMGMPKEKPAPKAKTAGKEE